MVGRPTRARAGAPVLLLMAVSLGVAGCSDDDDAADTLATLPPSASAPPTDATAVPGVTTAVVASEPTTTLAPDQAGSGFVSINVRLAATGIDETLTLDRATIALEQLDTVGLDAHCTALDGGDGMEVSVVDLRRLTAGNRLVSAVLRVEGDLSGGGDYEATLDVGDSAQTVTHYTGTVTVDDALASGSFDTRDAGGAAATGTFVCADRPVVTTTVPTTGGGEDVPGSDPSTPSTSSTLLLPPATVPLATS